MRESSLLFRTEPTPCETVSSSVEGLLKRSHYMPLVVS